MKCAVLGSPIAHSLSPLLHNRAYEILEIEGSYEAIDITENRLVEFLEGSLEAGWNGFNLTMPLKESVFSSSLCTFDSRSTLIRSANTLLRNENQFVATSTDLLAFEELFKPFPADRVAIIGGGGTARAAVGALAGRTGAIDLFLRSPARIDAIKDIAPQAIVRAVPMDSPLHGYDIIVNTTPAGAADHLASTLESVDGLYLESLYKPWPTELAFAWKELGGIILHGADLLVEQALYAIEMMTYRNFDYALMRQELLEVALSHLSSQTK